MIGKLRKIQSKAYEYFLARGKTGGNDLRDWLKAERDILRREDKVAQSKISRKARALK